MKGRRLITSVLGFLALAGCKDDRPSAVADDTGTDSDSTGTDGDTETETDTDTDTDGEPIDPHAASPHMRELLEAACDLSLRCCSRGEVDYYLGPWVDAESCADRLFDLATVSPAAIVDLASLAGLTDVSLVIPNLAALDQAVQEGRVVIDEAAVETCRDHLDAVACNEAEPATTGCQPLPPPPGDGPCDLDDLFVGQLLEDEVCTTVDGASLDCAPGLTCAIGLGLGDSGRCVAIKQEHEPCSSSDECEHDLYCAPIDATCQRLRTAGEVCVFADREDPSPLPETLLLGCTADLSCDPITSTCVARCQAGAACLVDEDCDAEQGLTCIVGRCGLPRAAGLPCGADDDCEEELNCGPDVFDPASFVCTPPKQNNADCLAHDECASGFCRPSTLRCSPQVDVGDACPSGDTAECDGGACVQEEPLTSCDTAVDCPITGVCNGLGQCGTYCVEAKPDGATCILDSECTSNACIAGFCRTHPLDVGVACEVPEDCGSLFCSYDAARVCAELPLPLGSPCVVNTECESLVCFTNECVNGSEEGEPCGDFEHAPCNPREYYCDQEAAPLPVCAPLEETGEDCSSEVECRGDCGLRFGRLLCTPAASEGAAICDGAE